MARPIASVFLFLVLVLVLSGCASTQVYWKKENWAKESSDDARTACAKHARMATNTDTATADDNPALQWSDYMKECMASHGYTLVRGHEPAAAPEPGKDDSRKTASEPPQPAVN